MHRWPGQGYEYIENSLFERGPFGGKLANGEQEEAQPATKQITAF